MADRPIIAVVGATGRQGGGVVRALQRQGRFRVRALTRDPAKHPHLADEVVRADLGDPQSLREAFAGAHGAFVVSTFHLGDDAPDEFAQGRAAVEAAREAGVRHFIWSTLPDVEAISGGRFEVPHFTDKAKVDALVAAAGFEAHTFVQAPFYLQNLTSVMAPHPLGHGTMGWALPIDPAANCIHMGDIDELGELVAGAFTHPDVVGSGQYLAHCGGRYAFADVVAAYDAIGRKVRCAPMPPDAYAGLYPGAKEIGQMLQYFEAHTYFGPDADARIALAREVSLAEPTGLAAWVATHVPRPDP